MKRVVIIGGGISALAAAWELLTSRPGLSVTVLEASANFGGKVRTSTFAGLPVDTGADAFLARVPDGVELCRELGLSASLESPVTSHALLWSRGALHKFPTDTVLGVPSNLDSLTDIISADGLERARAEADLPESVGREAEDPSIAELVGARLGPEIVDRLVNPLVGGINAGDVAHLSVSAATPQIADAAKLNASLVAGAAAQVASRVVASTPVFYAPSGGMGVLVDALVAQLSERGVSLLAGTSARSLSFDSAEWTVTTDHNQATADAIIVATPAPHASSMLSDVLPAAADELSGIKYASVAMIRLSYASSAVQIPLDASGFVIPAVEGRLLTACSWASSKWAELSSPDRVILRASVGRYGEDTARKMSDAQLIAHATEELAEMMQITSPPLEVDITRWPSSFPQYMPGHAARIERIEAAVSNVPSLALAGAAYKGLGVPACIKSGRLAARKLLAG